MPARSNLTFVWMLCLATPAAGAQATASLGLGAGTVRVPGSATLGMFLLTPGLAWSSPQRVLSLGGTFAVLPGGRRYGQGQGEAWITSPAVVGRWRAAASAAASGASLQRGGSNGVAQIGVEAVWLGTRWGLGLGGGAGAGAISGSLPVTAPHGRVHAWWQDAAGGTVLLADLEPTRFLGAWYTDLAASISWHRNRLDAVVSAGARVSSTYASRGAGAVVAQWRVSDRLSLEGGVGRVLPDPYQGLPASTFASAGIRFLLRRRSAASRGVIRARGFDVSPGADGWVVRFRDRDATHVSIAGDWNDWVPEPLQRVGRSSWQVTLHLSPGAYHFRLLVDGMPWSIPPGVPVIQDDFGDRVAVLTVF